MLRILRRFNEDFYEKSHAICVVGSLKIIVSKTSLYLKHKNKGYINKDMFTKRVATTQQEHIKQMAQRFKQRF